MLIPFHFELLPNISCFGFVSYKEPWIHFKRKADEYFLYIIKSGELYLKEGDQCYVLKKGDCMLLQPGLSHVGYKKSCCDYYYIHFRLPALPSQNKSPDDIAKEILKNRYDSLMSNPQGQFEYSNSLCYVPNYYHISDDSVYLHFVYTLKEALDGYNKKSEHYRTYFACQLIELLISLSKEYVATVLELHQSTYSKDFLKVEAIQNYISGNYTKKINSWDIEHEFKFNYDYLNRIFHRMTGYTILSYLNIIRMNKAKELLEQTSCKLSEITFSVGITDPYNFSKTFKKMTGASPMEYRKSRIQNT